MKTILFGTLLFFGISSSFAAEPNLFELHSIADIRTDRAKEYSMPDRDGRSQTHLLDATVLLDHTAVEFVRSKPGSDGHGNP